MYVLSAPNGPDVGKFFDLVDTSRLNKPAAAVEQQVLFPRCVCFVRRRFAVNGITYTGRLRGIRFKLFIFMRFRGITCKRVCFIRGFLFARGSKEITSGRAFGGLGEYTRKCASRVLRIFISNTYFYSSRGRARESDGGNEKMLKVKTMPIAFIIINILRFKIIM